MILKVPALREEIGDPLDICIVLTEIFHPPSHFLQRVERRQDSCCVCGRGEDCELDLERCELVGGQIMR